MTYGDLVSHVKFDMERDSPFSYACHLQSLLPQQGKPTSIPIGQGPESVNHEFWQRVLSLLVVSASELGGSAVLLIQALPPILRGFP